jgi:ElaB/YqjD/DUF883 family membrane-anchored ribosome-binding protein
MGNNKSKPEGNRKPKRPGVTPESVEEWYANFFKEFSAKENDKEEMHQSYGPQERVPEETTSGTPSSPHEAEVHDNSGDNPDEEESTPARGSGPGMSQPDAFGQSAGSTMAVQAARQAVIDKVQLLATQARDKLKDAVEQVKRLGFVGVAKVAGRWIKEHPWEAAAIIAFIVVLASTPAILGAIGFTSAGIAAGKNTTIKHISCRFNKLKRKYSRRHTRQYW